MMEMALLIVMICSRLMRLRALIQMATVLVTMQTLLTPLVRLS